MTTHLRSSVVRASTMGEFRADTMPLTRWPESPRYCASCGCRLRTTNRARICDPCDNRARAAHYTRQDWLIARGLL